MDHPHHPVLGAMDTKGYPADWNQINTNRITAFTVTPQATIEGKGWEEYCLVIYIPSSYFVVELMLTQNIFKYRMLVQHSGVIDGYVSGTSDWVTVV